MYGCTMVNDSTAREPMDRHVSISVGKSWAVDDQSRSPTTVGDEMVDSSVLGEARLSKR